MNKGSITVVIIIVVAALIWLVAASQKEAPDLAPPAPSKRIDISGSGPEGKPAKPPPPPPKDPWREGLAVATSGHIDKIRKLAMEWRRKAREDALFLVQLINAVKDPTGALEVRELCAFILGSFQNKEGLAAVADALPASSGSLARVLLLALGSEKFSDDNDIFALAEGPRVVRTPIGLSVEIRGRVVEAEWRDRMIPRLKSAEPTDVRSAAAFALSDSSEFAEVRKAFMEALATENDQPTQGELARALAAWAAGQPEETPDRPAVVTALLEGARRPEAAALRSKSEDSLKRLSWSAAELGLAMPLMAAGPIECRRWAVAVLAGAASRSEMPGRQEILTSLERACEDPDAKLREISIGGLASFADQPKTAEILIKALGDAEAANRIVAAKTLAKVPRSEGAVAALQKLQTTDPDLEVKRDAAETLRILSK